MKANKKKCELIKKKKKKLFLYARLDTDNSITRLILGSPTSSSAIGTSPTHRQRFEHKKSVTFNDGVKPGIEANTSTASAIAATNNMSSHETDIDQVSLFKPGLILDIFVLM